MMFRKQNLFSILLVGLVISSVLAVHFFLISKEQNLIPATRVMDIVDNVMAKENGELPFSGQIKYLTPG